MVDTVLVARRTDDDTPTWCPAATSGSTRRCHRSARPAPTSGWAPRTRCSSSTPRAAPASPRGCCTPPAATWSTRPHAQAGLRLPPGRHLLLRRGHRLDHRPQLHRLRAARQRRDDGDVRVDAGLPRPGPLLADRRRPRREHLLHGADGAARARAARRRVGEEVLARQSLRILGTVGEPINPEVWKWYHDVVGDGRAPWWTPGGRPRRAAS
jgi:hypothetical protein